MPKAKENTSINLTVTPELLAAIDAFAARDSRTRTGAVRRLVENALHWHDHDDYVPGPKWTVEDWEAFGYTAEDYRRASGTK